MAQSVPRFKVVIIGDSGVGKSSLLIRFVRGEFHHQTRSTISAAYLTRRVDVEDRTVQFEIWDTAGQERFRSLNTPMYYRGASAAVIVYDISDPDSFKNARGWYTQLKTMGEPGVVVALVGNKADLEEKRQVDNTQVEEFAAQNNLFHRLTSAQSGLNVEDVFEELARRMPHETEPPPQDPITLLQPSSNSPKESGGCC
mmetsp:Transcript_13351/g.38818  ORF Transcript_13351/g.38818 Transcript_13351/m.38818 type:complete len:199 (-) Transcript_13351:291-887(-)|eukprot:CAMPEP_0118974936 /NCGR_PEP_ID=MMETSP1173-20130426/13971_1 /TAXON_ID=1034831 /ORGANISM="Rhizochromulina marina cf, Strain CCMP1243" /LENGTH=198 /DNA_ID=CAMNT_0006924751 /DNA_START=118 /DNA_END=714 /DNA_ORIENTATION=-